MPFFYGSQGSWAATKQEAMKRLLDASSHMPLGTEVKIEKVYKMKRGHEPNAPFRHDAVAGFVLLQLVDHGTGHDVKTGRPRPPQWKILERASRKSSSEDFTIDFIDPALQAQYDAEKAARHERMRRDFFGD